MINFMLIIPALAGRICLLAPGSNEHAEAHSTIIQVPLV